MPAIAMTNATIELQRDTAPSEVISEAEAKFERGRKMAGAIAAPLAFALIAIVSTGLDYKGRMLAGVVAAVAVLWMTEALPLPVTALLGPALCIVLGVADARTALAPFADPIAFLFIGSFMLARAMARHGLDRRIALAFLSWPWIVAHPARLLAGVGLVTGVVSMWISNSAAAAMMLPITVGIIQALESLRPGDRSPAQPWPYATGLLLMTSFAASIGGLATPVGTPPNLIGLGFIRQLIGVKISFFGWMALAVPITLLLAAVLFGILGMLHSAERGGDWSQGLETYLRRQREQFGPWTAGQINALIALGLAFSLWLLPGILGIILPEHHPVLRTIQDRLPESVVGLAAALLLFVLPVNLRRGEFTLTWSDAARIDWGTILLFGCGMSLGNLMFSTGVARALGSAILSLTGASSLWGLTAVSIALTIVLSEATSNTASASMMVPVVISLAQAAGVSPLPPALGATMGATFGFMLPVSTPPNAIVYGSGLVPITRMMRAGILFDILGFATIWLGLRILCPLLGLI